MNQFHAGCGLGALIPGRRMTAKESHMAAHALWEDYSETDYSSYWSGSDPAVLISESAARAIVAAIDDNRPHRAAHLIKELPWFAEILSGVRATRHLQPQAYIKLSERPMQMIESVDAVGSDGCKIGLTTFRQIP